jgi:hypothetical protein
MNGLISHMVFVTQCTVGSLLTLKDILNMFELENQILFRLLCHVEYHSLGSVLEQILFLLYTADLLRLTQRRDLCPHLYADDAVIRFLPTWCH